MIKCAHIWYKKPINRVVSFKIALFMILSNEKYVDNFKYRLFTQSVYWSPDNWWGYSSIFWGYHFIVFIYFLLMTTNIFKLLMLLIAVTDYVAQWRTIFDSKDQPGQWLDEWNNEYLFLHHIKFCFDSSAAVFSIWKRCLSFA